MLKFANAKLSSFPCKYTSFSRANSTAASSSSPPGNTKIFTSSSSSSSRANSTRLSRKHKYNQQPKAEVGFRSRRYYSVRLMGRNKEDQWIKSGLSQSTLPDHDDKLSPKSLSSSSSSSKLLTLPTILTIARVVAVPLLVATFYVESWWGPPATTCIFIAAAITDWLDGYLARRMKLGTAFGAFLDPVADKLMVAATLVLLCSRPLEAGIFGQAPWLLPVPAISIIGREITMSAVREWAASQGSKLSEAVAVNNLGKWKTATQMIALTILLGTRGGSMIGTGALVTSGVVLLYFSAWLAVWSLVVYVRKIWKVLLM